MADATITLNTRHTAKSQRAHELAMEMASQLAPFDGLGQHQFGTGRGEQMGMPSNYKPPTANIYVRNWSRTKMWKRLWIPVSGRRGAEDALSAKKELRNLYNVDTYARKAAEGADMNLYKEEIFPVIFAVRVPGGPNGMGGSHPSRLLPIPPAIDNNAEPPKVQVPEGTWDLYLGNYERMRSKDPRERQQAQVQLSNYWRFLHNPVWKISDDGQEEIKDETFGVLEFIREPIHMMQTPVDKEYLTAMEIFEA